MPKPIQHGDDYDSDPEVQAEKEMAKIDPEGYAIGANSLTSQKKAMAAGGKDEVSTTPPNVVLAGNGAAGSIAGVPRSKSTDEVAKKPKAHQSKALKKQRSRGISGCSSKKFAGYDDDDYEMDGYDPQDFDEDDEDNYTNSNH